MTVGASVPRRVLCVLISAVFASTMANAQVRALAATNQEGVRPGPDLEGFLGRPVETIQIVSVSRRWAGSVQLRRVRVGDEFSAMVTRRALSELAGTGRFASVRAEVSQGKSGVVLRLFVEPRRIVSSARVIGGVIDASETLRLSGIGQDSEVTIAGLAGAELHIRELYARRGYPAAKVGVEALDTDDPMRVVVTVSIDPGAQRTIDRVDIVSPNSGSSVADAGQNRHLREVVSNYGASVGDAADEARLASADSELETLLWRGGWLDARVTHDLRNASVDGADLRVSVLAGPRYRIRFSGQRSFSERVLFGVVDPTNASDRSIEGLEHLVRDYYVSSGFLDAQVDARISPGPEKGERTLELRVDEGRVVRVGKRDYPCLSGSRSANFVSREIDSFLVEAAPDPPIADEAVVNAIFGSRTPTPSLPRPPDIDPRSVFNPAAYARAVAHLNEIYRADGYLSAEIGPARLVRRPCVPDTHTGRCAASATEPAVVCEPDAATAQLTNTCQPDAARGVVCDSDARVVIPMRLGPRTFLYDVAFAGNDVLVEQDLVRIAGVEIGAPLSYAEIETARNRLRAAYAEEGYPFANVQTSSALSPDQSRAGVRFQIAEGPQVRVAGVIVVGAKHTSDQAYQERITLHKGDTYRTSAARETEEQFSALGVFSSVNVGLEDPDVPAKEKYVVIQVTERLPQYLELGAGVSTGEGIRASFGYGNRNLGGRAIDFGVRTRVGFLPEALILDETLREALYPSDCATQNPKTEACQLNAAQRLDASASVSFEFPNIGLGPRVRLRTEALFANDLNPNYLSTRLAAIGGFVYRPGREVTAQLALSTEQNVARILSATEDEDSVFVPGENVRIPNGRSIAFVQGVSFRWDRRDNPLQATRGTLVTGVLDHVLAFPCADATMFDACETPVGQVSHFLRPTGRVSGYIELPWRFVLAVSLSGGYIVPLRHASQTYPDRLFFMGGVDTLRSYALDTLMPQDFANALDDVPLDEQKAELSEYKVRGGNVFVNPRLELRIPITSIFATAVFLDSGNLWFDRDSVDPTELRYAVGAGVRVGTPIGPLAFDYGFNLFPRWWEKEDGPGAFHFSIGLF